MSRNSLTDNCPMTTNQIQEELNKLIGGVLVVAAIDYNIRDSCLLLQLRVRIEEEKDLTITLRLDNNLKV